MKPLPTNTKRCRIPFFSQFTRITSIEQRRQYKTEFDKDYTEYMKLHAENERVSKRFAQLEESLRNTDHNEQRYKVSVCCVTNSIYMPAERTRSLLYFCRLLFIQTGNSTANSQRVQEHDE